MKKGKKGENGPNTTSRAAGSYRDILRTALNIIFCLVGLALGYLYLVRHQFIGWFFIGAFTFLLFLQFPDARQSDD